MCSHFKPIKKEIISEEKSPILVYSHGNSGNRLACYDEIPFCLNNGMELFCYDFTGCGRSEGEKISLGYFEKLDLEMVVDHLSGEGYKKIALWGRSMGAATTILYASSQKVNENIKCIIVDSPFTSIYDIAMYLATNQIQIKIPKFLLGLFAKFGISRLRNMVLNEELFDFYEVNPLESIKNCKIATLFIVGKIDTLVPATHSTKLCEVLKSNYVDAKVFTCYGGHNDMRRFETWDNVGSHLCKYLFNGEKENNKFCSISKELITDRSRGFITRSQYHVTNTN